MSNAISAIHGWKAAKAFINSKYSCLLI